MNVAQPIFDNTLGYTLLGVWSMVLLVLLVYRDSLSDPIKLSERNEALCKWYDDVRIGKMVKEIISKEGELHFRRWRIIETGLFNVYVHKIYRADEDLDHHNHPWNFIVFCINGSYAEEVSIPNTTAKELIFVRPHSIRFRSRKQFHKIRRMFTGVVTTLVFTFGKKELWGYDVNGNFEDHLTYRYRKNHDKLKKKADEYDDSKLLFGELAKLLKTKTANPAEIKKGIENLLGTNEEQLALLKKLKS